MSIFAKQKPVWVRNHQPQGIERFFLRDKFRAFDNFYVHMFLQDCSQMVPYRRLEEGKGRFAINSNNPDLAQQIMRSLGTRHSRANADDILRSLCEEVTQALLVSGRALYTFEVEEKDSTLEFGFSRIKASYIFKIFGSYFQYAPAEQYSWPDEKNDTKKARFLNLDDSMVLSFQLPISLRYKLKSMMRKLSKLSDWKNPNLELMYRQPTLENPNPESGPFDFQEFRKKLDIALFRSIEFTGWSARDYDGKKQSDFFHCVRHLRFRRFQARIRDLFLEQLSAQLQSAVRQYEPDFDFQILPDNLLTNEIIDQMAADLESGKLAFSKLIDETLES